MDDFLYEDPELGKILFRYNSRAKRYIIRIKPDQISVTIPLGGNFEFAVRFFRGNRNKIISKIEMQKEKNSNSLPPIPEPILRQKAKAYLPQKLEQLAKEHGFKYREVKISKSKTRWGSCSTKASINLSLYLILLPEFLIEYVLLHELCHTVEMNHGPAFWALLDKHTHGKAKELKKQLKTYFVNKQ